MKKYMILFLVATIACTMIFSSCKNKQSTTEAQIKTQHTSEVQVDEQYKIMNAIYQSYIDVQELEEEANVIFTGKVTGVSFQLLDGDALPLTSEEKDWMSLYTIYDIDVYTIYKGAEYSPKQVRVWGGIQDFMVEEQLAVMGKAAENGIPIFSAQGPEIKIGESYLFVMFQYETGLPTILNHEQSFFNLNNPFKEDREVVTGEKADLVFEKYGRYPASITAKDIISEFGKEKWDEFWTQWQKDNPGWEKRLDKAAVEKALAE